MLASRKPYTHSAFLLFLIVLQMANCVNYGCDDALGVYNENVCGEELTGGANQVVLLECNHQLTDASNGTELAAEISAGRATLVTGAYLSIEAPSPVTQDSIQACKPPVLVNYNRTGTYKNGNVSSANLDFHNGIFVGKKFGGLIIYECGTSDAAIPQVTWIDNQVTFTGGRILPGSQELQRFEGTFSWQSKTDPRIYAVPANIFD